MSIDFPDFMEKPPSVLDSGGFCSVTLRMLPAEAGTFGLGAHVGILAAAAANGDPLSTARAAVIEGTFAHIARYSSGFFRAVIQRSIRKGLATAFKGIAGSLIPLHRISAIDTDGIPAAQTAAVVRTGSDAANKIGHFFVSPFIGRFRDLALQKSRTCSMRRQRKNMRTRTVLRYCGNIQTYFVKS